MQDSLCVSIDLEVCLPNFYSENEDILINLKNIQDNIFDFISIHKDEFKVRTLFELKESQD